MTAVFDMADTPLTDDYVASLLAKDAKESSIRYSALGMGAFLQTKYILLSEFLKTLLMPSRQPVNKPKPNTRFLRTIIKETDNHNAALLAKEAAESKMRLESLVTKENRSTADIRRRQLGHITAHLSGGAKRRHVHSKETPQRIRDISSDEEDTERKGTNDNIKGERIPRERRDDHKEKDERKSRNSHHRNREHDREERNDRKPRDTSSRDIRSDLDNENSSRKHRRHRSRSGERKEHTTRHRDRKNQSRSRSRSPRHSNSNGNRHRQRSPQRSSRHEKKESDRSRGKRRSRNVSPFEEDDVTREESREVGRREKSRTVVDYDSDPLDSIIGPRPPPISEVRSRGRGLTSSASGIDSRFSSNYDPKIDVAVEEDDDWDQALEALRDRTKWKQQGADRLRAAGFTEEEVKKWEKGSKTEEDVKWAKKGEGREWDRGKVVGADGLFGVSSEENTVSKEDVNWGRLT
jgi:hypothetical protein